MLASGIADSSTAIMALVQMGDHLITHADVYGGTFGYFHEVLPRIGIEQSFVDVTDLAAIEAAIQDNTKVIVDKRLPLH